jgi:hypothetical protein
MLRKLKELFVYYFPKPDGSGYTNKEIFWWLLGWGIAVLLLLLGFIIIIGEAYQLFQVRLF